MTVKFADLVANSAEIMKLDLARIRLATKHAGLKGGAAEEILSKFLQQRLPGALGVTTGHVVDAAGKLSKQADVIIYDALRTPVLFESALDGWDVVPAEGVVAVVEVKMHLTSSDLPVVVANCDSVAGLSREAYIGHPSHQVAAYGTVWSELPIYYSLFAFESDSMYAGQLNELLKDRPLHQRIGSVCYLDRGVNLHADLSTGTGRFSALATPLGTLFDVESPNALLVWLTSLSSVVVQAGRRPIDLMRYAPDEHQLLGTLPPGSPKAQLELATKGGAQTLQALGMEPGLAQTIASKVLSSQPLDEGEVQAITALGGTIEPDGKGGQKLTLPSAQ